MKIKAYTSYSERTNTRYYRDFEIVDKLPGIGEVIYEYCGDRKTVTEINEVMLDYEQGNDKVYDYKYYALTIKFEELSNDNVWIEDKDNEETLYVAIEKEDEDNEDV